MKANNHTTEQIINKLREADALLGSGQTVAVICKQLGVSQHAYYRWRSKYGNMKMDEARRLKELGRENQQLKRLVADQALDLSILKEVARGNF
jgi:transposase-like protein